MWQLFSLLSLVTKALENSLDKMAIIRGSSVDPIVMSFYRVAIYVAIIVAIGLTGIVDRFEFVADWRMPLLGLWGALVSLGYTYVVGKLEVTNMAAMSYMAPVGFLLIDVFALGTDLTAIQICGIMLLALGGIGYSFERNTRRLKAEISLPILGVLIFMAAFGGLEGYVFKYMHASHAEVGATAFFWTSWAWSALALLGWIVIQGKFRQMLALPARTYASRCVAAKACDAGTTLFAAQALALASVSQVSSMNSFDPIVLLLVTALIQIAFRIHLGERFDRRNLEWKALMAVILVIGWFMVW